MLPVAIIADAQYISFDKQVIPIKICIDISITIGQIRHTHFIVHAFLQRGTRQKLFVITSIDAIKCSSYIKPMREAIKQ